MKKKSSLILASTIGAISLVAGCAGDSYRYEVSGVVEARQIDYDCPGEDVAMAPIGFQAAVAGRPKPPPRSNTSTSDTPDTAEAPRSSNRTPSTAPSKAASSAPGRSAPASSAPVRTERPVKKSKGVKLDKKPAKPVKVPKFLKAALPLSLAGCKEEPELFIRNADGLFEQDVRRVDYDRCPEKSDFPACTEG